MQKDDRLKFCDLPLHSARRPVEFFCQSLNGDAVDQTALYDGAIALRVNVLIDDPRHGAVGVLNHRTRPVPPQVGQTFEGVLLLRVTVERRFLGAGAVCVFCFFLR
jgi:hypothetical protein